MQKTYFKRANSSFIELLSSMTWHELTNWFNWKESHYFYTKINNNSTLQLRIALHFERSIKRQDGGLELRIIDLWEVEMDGFILYLLVFPFCLKLVKLHS